MHLRHLSLEGTQTLDCCTPTVTAKIGTVTINGTKITIGAANTIVNLPPDITVTVNEQIKSCTAGSETSEANVIHINSPTLFAGMDIWLGHTKLISSGGKCCP